MRSVKNAVMFFMKFTALTTMFLSFKFILSGIAGFSDFKNFYNSLPSLSIVEGILYRGAEPARDISLNFKNVFLYINHARPAEQTDRSSAIKAFVVIKDNKGTITLASSSTVRTIPFDLSGIKSLVFDKRLLKSIQGFWNVCLAIMPLALFLKTLLFESCFIFFFSYLYYLVSKITEPVRALSSRTVLTAGIYSAVPSMLMSTAARIMNIHTEYSGIVYLGVFLLFLNNAFKSIEQAKNSRRRQPLK